DGLRFSIQYPMHDVERVMSQVGHLTAGIIPEPTKMINASLGIVLPPRSRSEEHVPIEFGWRIAVRRRAEAGEDVAIRVHAHRVDVSDLPVTNQLPRSLIV